MSDRTYTVFLRGKNLTVTDTQLSGFKNIFLEPSDLADRMSELLWLDLYVYSTEMGVSPHNILDAIRNLENGETKIGVKSATQFQHAPLKGLWHKHYFSAQFLVQNIIQGFGKNGLENLINEIMDPNKSKIITPEMIDELAHRATVEPVEKRAAQNKLTGEWIIFHKREGKNYYLCCNTHDAGDQAIYDRILDHCTRDFPDLKRWLSETAA